MGKLEAGALVGDRYEVVRVLGTGSGSITYEAETIDTGRHVAVKQLLLWERQGWKSLELFRREAAVLDGLDHPSIPKLIESFELEAEEGTAFFLVRELVVGESLRELVQSGQRFEEEAIEQMARELLEILAHLHTLAPPVIHRDIKPSNVIQRADGSLALIDFGAVRKPSEMEGSTVVGTYGYMAPEQFRGNAVPASDIYGVGATVLHLLTHQAPSDLPQKGLRVDLDEITLSPKWRAWLNRALEPDPERRFASAREAISALDGKMPARQPQTPPNKRRTAALATVLALVIGAGAGSIAYLESSVPTDTSPASVDEPLESFDRGRYVQPKHKLEGFTDIIFGLSFAPDGQMVTGTRDGKLQVWDIESEQAVHTFAGLPKGRLIDTEVSPDGQWLLVGVGNRGVLYDLSTRKLVRALEAHRYEIRDVDFSLDGELIATASNGGDVMIHQREDGKVLHTLRVKGQYLTRVAFLADGRTVATASHSGPLFAWAVESGEQVQEWDGHTGSVSEIVRGADDRSVISAGDDKAVGIWRLGNRTAIRSYGAHYDEVWEVALSPNGQTLLSGGRADVITTLDTQKNRVVDRRHARMQGVVKLTFSSDGALFAAAGRDRTVGVWPVPGSIWRPEVPPENYEPVVVDDPVPSTPHARLVFEARKILDAWPRSDLNEAARLLDRAEAAQSDYAPIHVQRARHTFKSGFIRTGKYKPGTLESAHAQIDKALSLEPNLVDAMIVKAYVYSFENNRGSARRWAEKAVQQAPDSPLAHLVVLEVAAKDDRVEDAIASAKRVFELTESARIRAGVCGALMDVYGHLKDHDAKEQMYLAMMRYKPTSAWTRGNYAQFLVNRGRYDEAIPMAKSALAMMDYGAARKTLAEAHAGRAIDLAPQKKVEEADKALSLALEAWPHPNARVEIAKGVVAFGHGLLDGDLDHVDTAMKHFEAARRIDPKNKWAKSWLNHHRTMVKKVREAKR